MLIGLLFLILFFVFIHATVYGKMAEGNVPYAERNTQSSRGRLVMPIPFRLRTGMLRTEDIDRSLHWMPYYQKLSKPAKDVFCGRVREFMQSKEFSGMMGLEVHFDMAVSVSAAAVQLTYGLEHYELSHFHSIRIFPEVFYSKINRNYLKGGASESGVIFLSWKHFVEGYKNGADTFNLGLHEFAHALKINTTQGSDFDEEFVHYFTELEKSSSPVIDSIRRGEHNFLRKYGGTNMHEFFAVCVEHFFEVPKLFREKLPDVYNKLCVLLNQDPCEEQRDYRLTSHHASERIIDRSLWKRMKDYRYAKWHWSLSILLAGIFLTPYFLFVLIPPVAISSSVLWAMYTAFLIGGFALQYRKIVKQQALNVTQFIFYLLLGFGPVLLTLVLGLNMLIILPGETVEQYKMTGVARMTSDGDYKIFLENDQYTDNNALTIVSKYDRDLIRKGNVLELSFKTGIFGIPFKNGYTIREK
ncbi:MAG: hypothetical protein FD123_2449 [Bacteroidetes bacterium]|nr:MAG: hypothetical protein FD123_2449 [Bacteroidota bacterium]